MRFFAEIDGQQGTANQGDRCRMKTRRLQILTFLPVLFYEALENVIRDENAYLRGIAREADFFYRKGEIILDKKINSK